MRSSMLHDVVGFFFYFSTGKQMLNMLHGLNISRGDTPRSPVLSMNKHSATVQAILSANQERRERYTRTVR